MSKVKYVAEVVVTKYYRDKKNVQTWKRNESVRRREEKRVSFVRSVTLI